MEYEIQPNMTKYKTQANTPLYRIDTVVRKLGFEPYEVYLDSSDTPKSILEYWHTRIWGPKFKIIGTDGRRYQPVYEIELDELRDPEIQGKIIKELQLRQKQ